MKKLTITLGSVTAEAKSESNMWTLLRGFRDLMNPELLKEDDPHALVTTEDGTLFKEIVFKAVKGKIQMVNLVKETCRRRIEKARKAAEEAAAKAEARKAKKREADRRYRARKKAAAEALKAKTMENNTVEENLPQEA